MSDHNLGTHTARGGAALMMSQGVKFVCQIVSLAILARFLAPSHFGLFVMAGAIVHFFSLVGTFGLVQAVIHRESISDRELNGLFLISAVTGMLLSALIYVAAPWFAGFYGEEEVKPLIRGLGAVLLIQGLGIQSRAMLEKEFKFFHILLIEALASVVALLIAVLLAWHGVKAWTLVVQELTMVSVHSLGFLLICRWKPGVGLDFGNLKFILGYGSGLTGSNVVNYLSRNVDNVLIGEQFGNAQLGLYQKAYSLILLPINQINQPLSRVLLPALSRLRDQPDNYIRAYRNAITSLCAFSIPIIVCMGLVSRELILIILGENWLQANRYFLLLLPAAFIGATNIGTGWVYTSYGHTARQMKWAVYNAVVIVTGIFISSRYSVSAVAVTLSVLFVLLRIPGVWYCFRTTPLKPMDYWQPVIRYGMSSVFSAALLSLIFQETESAVLDENILLSLIVKSALFVLITFLADLLIPGRTFKEIFQYILEKYRTKKA